MDYITVRENYESEIEIKKSIFIGHIFHTDTVDEAINYLEQVRKKHYKATHNCYAYIIGENKEHQKASDDGEPAKTAGRPILNVIEQNDLTNVLIVVTRYFGGIKLGAGGLIRAYSASAGDVLSKADLIKKETTMKINLIYDYNLHGKIEDFLRKSSFMLETPSFLDKVSYNVYVNIKEKDKFMKELIDITNAKIDINEDGICYIDKPFRR